MDRFFGTVALTGLALALLVHVAACLGLDVGAQFPAVWILFVGIPIVFFPFVSCSQRTLGNRPTLSDLRAAFPGWVIIATILLAIYAWIGFLAGTAPLPAAGGVPTERDHKYVIANHGVVLREISAAQYHAFEASNLRGLSSLWLLFYFLPTAYFVFRNKDESVTE